MSKRVVKAVSDMDIDEISLVDRPANQHASVMIAKAYQGDPMAEKATETGYFWDDGSPVMTDDEIGPDDRITNAEGEVFALSDEAIAELEAEANAGREDELVGAGAPGAEIGKSLFGRQAAAGRPAQRGGVQKSLVETLQETISKAVGEEGLREGLSKAVELLAKADKRASDAETLAKAEQNLRLEREFVAKAATYGALPIAPEVLGPILKRCAEYLPEADCVELNKVFTATGEILFQELGMQGGGSEDGSDPMAQVNAAIEAGSITKVAKNDEGETVTLSKAEQTVAYFAEHPELYDDYRAQLGQRS